MAIDFEIFEGKTLSDVFKDIYDNSKRNKEQLEVLSTNADTTGCPPPIVRSLIACKANQPVGPFHKTCVTIQTHFSMFASL